MTLNQSPVTDPVNCPKDGLEIDKMVHVPTSAKRKVQL
jgi:hypothetical protein